MNFIKECFEEHGRVLMDELGRVGFSINQAIDFLPEAVSSISASTKDPCVAQAIDNLLTDDSSHLLSTINMEVIVQKLGLNSELVMSGFRVITPFCLNSFLNRE